MQLGKQLSNGASRAAGAEFIRLLAGFGSGEAEFPPHAPLRLALAWAGENFCGGFGKRANFIDAPPQNLKRDILNSNFFCILPCIFCFVNI